MEKNSGFNEEIFQRFDQGTFAEYEKRDIKRRIMLARRELKELVLRFHDVARLKNPALPPEIPPSRVSKLMKELVLAMLNENQKPELKTAVVRRMADKMGQQILYTRLTSIPVIHELVALAPWWLCHFQNDVVETIRDIGLRYFMNGMVIPVQAVRQELYEARAVYLGHCVCRSSGIVDDLTTNDQPFTILSKPENDLLLQRLMNTYRALQQRQQHAQTSEHIHDIFSRLKRLQGMNSADYTIESFFQAFYPTWEFIPVHEHYTPNWIRSMYLNNKAFKIHPRLAVEVANAFYYSRGIVFNSMKLLDTRYTICSCPSPENSGGCILTNWYYFAQANDSLITNQKYHGQRKNERGTVRNCNVFPIRSRKQCLGCGCLHQTDQGRDMEHGLKETDQLFGHIAVGQ
ncbi:hypothetical protein ACFL27_02265 [candidate division CSSED10-310 bacterium]|uniref:Uncharacterized protein n=1 Tax=candidate division CSSED10-310 bacterium TaxID=2855610 RepID=A0ABV6YS36_UNCC1